MTQKKKEKYIKSIKEFDKWALTHCKQGMIYRGVKNSQWDVEASLYRRLKKNDMPQDIIALTTATNELIERAEKEEHHQKDGKKMKNLELLAELQHYGAATCLIDFTNNRHVALWFACQPISDKKSQGGKIIALNIKSFPKVNSEDWEKGIEHFLDKSQKRLWKWSPPPQNPRISNQQSIFILGKTIIECKETDEICIVPEKAKKSILKELKEKYNISKTYLYPPGSIFPDPSKFVQKNAWRESYDSLALDYLLHGKNLYRPDDVEQSIENCNKALNKDRKNIGAYFLLGVINGRKGNYKEALANFDEVILINQQHAPTYYFRGIVLSDKGNYDEAIDDFDTAIDIDLKYEKAYYYRGFTKGQTGDYDGAIDDFDTVIQINPQHDDAHCFRGAAKSDNGDHDGAIDDFNMAIEINPQHENAHCFRGVAYSRNGKHKNAMEDYDKVIDINPNYGDVYYFRGSLKRRKGDYDGAIDDFDVIIENQPEHEQTLYLRGYTKLQKGDCEGAIDDFDKVIQINPKYEECCHSRALAKLKKGDNNGAIADCGKAIDINPQYARAYHCRGFAKYRLENYEEADKDYRKAKEIAPDDLSIIPYSTIGD